LELRQANILEIDKSWGTFDYIIVHGVYSWVPANVQQHTLGVIRDLLSPSGLAFVSYNVNPGWRLKGAVRDLAQYYTARFDNPKERVRQARALVEFMASSMQSAVVGGVEEPLVRLLQDEAGRFPKYPDSYVLHEYLEPCNEPVYFHEFARRVTDAGLKYVGDARPASMATSGFPADVEKGLRTISRDMVELEQFLDLMRSRVFRESILCRPEVKLDHGVTPERLEGLYFAAPLTPMGGRVPTQAEILEQGRELKWVADNDNEVGSAEPVGKAVLHVLSMAAPAAVEFGELSRLACLTLGTEPSAAVLRRVGAVVMGLIFGQSEVVELLTTPYPLASQINPTRPVACPLVRRMAELGEEVTSRRHKLVRLHESFRSALQRLDGRPRREVDVSDAELAKFYRHGLMIA
jgi:hypothetical protein